MFNDHLIKILPNLYVANYNYENNNIMDFLNSPFVVNVNNFKSNLTNYVVYDLNIDISNVDISNPCFDFVIDFIVFAHQNNYPVIIFDQHNLISFIILLLFISKFLKIPFGDCYYWLFFKLDVNKKLLSDYIIFELYFKYLHYV